MLDAARYPPLAAVSLGTAGRGTAVPVRLIAFEGGIPAVENRPDPGRKRRASAEAALSDRSHARSYRSLSGGVDVLIDCARMMCACSRIPMILAFNIGLRKPARQANHQSPQRYQVLALWLEREVIVKDAEGVTKVVRRRVDLLFVGNASARGSMRSSAVRIVHDDTSSSLVLPA
ncbi:protein of unknown function [Candidatus Methylomirabilis oxygeniifera]|uniref:Uncharacterized protein n=1 Tax=Methylomirabilis oxygeniifera TaxID=671143 RepID=D5MGY1_METO1|nr:protein of unknown function [Candidatus Methylomirabilis oxyfera]